MLCSQVPYLRLDDPPLSMSDWEKTERVCDFSCIYERKAHQAKEDKIPSPNETECRCTRQDPANTNTNRCSLHREFFPSLEAIDEVEEGDETKAVEELDKKYDLSLPDRHYSKAKNMGYLQHRKGRHFRRKAFGRESDFPRRQRSVTF